MHLFRNAATAKAPPFGPLALRSVAVAFGSGACSEFFLCDFGLESVPTGNTMSSLPSSRPTARLGFHLRSLVLGAASIHLLACGEIQLPPPAAPAKMLPAPPEVPSDPVPEGGGRLVLDANGEQARVVEVAGTTVQSRGYTFNFIAQRPVCASTPCVVDVPRGPHHLLFLSKTDENRGSDVELDVGARPRVIRHAMGERIEHGALKAGSNVALTLGILGAITGGSVMFAGALSSGVSSDPTSNAGNGTLTAGGAVLGISAGVLALGITLGILGRTEVRKGSTTEWPLDTNGNEGAPRNSPTTTHVRLTPTSSGLGLTF